MADLEGTLRLTPEQPHAPARRRLARIRHGQCPLDVAYAEAAVRLIQTSPKCDDGLIARREACFNAARIHAQALEFAANEVSRQGERAITLYRTYRSRALDLLQQALAQVPE